MGHHLLRLGLLLTCFALGYTAALGDPPRYTIQLLEPGSEMSTPYGISNAGRVLVQTSWYDNVGRGRVWLPTGSFVDLGGPSGWDVGPRGINNQGWVVGWKNFNLTGIHPFLYKDGVMTDLPAFALGGLGEARAINNLGVVAGTATGLNGDTLQACVWENGLIRALGTVPDLQMSVARDLNDAGTAVGLVDFFNRRQQAYLWQGGVPLELPLVANQTLGAAHAINEGGDVVGFSFNPGNERALLWPSSNLFNPIDLGTVSEGSIAVDINRHRVVVGFSFDPSMLGIAWVWKDGQIHDLNDCLVGNSGWLHLHQARAINDAGQIVGWGEYGTPFQYKSFLLTPVLDPPTLVAVEAVGVKPNKVRGLTPVLCTVRIDRHAGAEPVPIELHASPSGHCIVPPTVSISSGNVVTFTIFTKRVTSTQNVALSARTAGTNTPWKSTTLVITR